MAPRHTPPSRPDRETATRPVERRSAVAVDEAEIGAGRAEHLDAARALLRRRAERAPDLVLDLAQDARPFGIRVHAVRELLA